MFSCLNSLSLYIGIFCFVLVNKGKCDSDDDEGVELIAEYYLGDVAESIEWDPVNKAYYFMSGSTYNVGRIDGSNLTKIVNGDSSLITYPFNLENYTDTSFFPSGMYTDGITLYINDFSGQIILIDIESKVAFDVWWIWNDYSTFTTASLNGMCYDSNNDHLYVTDTGINFTTLSSDTNTGMIYRINITDGSYEKVYNSSNDDGGLIHPNGCTVSDDGTLFAIENSYESTSRLIIYDISSDTWNFVDSPARGDGIVFSNDGDLFITAFDVTSSSTDGLYMISSDSIDNGNYTFELVLSNLTSPADMDYNRNDSVVVFPSLDLDTFNFVMYVVEIDQDSETTTTESMETDGVYSITNNAIGIVNSIFLIGLVIKQLLC